MHGADDGRIGPLGDPALPGDRIQIGDVDLQAPTTRHANVNLVIPGKKSQAVFPTSG